MTGAKLAGVLRDPATNTPDSIADLLARARRHQEWCETGGALGSTGRVRQ